MLLLLYNNIIILFVCGNSKWTAVHVAARASTENLSFVDGNYIIIYSNLLMLLSIATFN